MSRKPLSPGALRSVAVTLKFNEAEILEIDGKRGLMKRPAFLRAAAFALERAALPDPYFAFREQVKKNFSDLLKIGEMIDDVAKVLAEFNHLERGTQRDGVAQRLESKFEDLCLLLSRSACDRDAMETGRSF